MSEPEEARFTYVYRRTSPKQSSESSLFPDVFLPEKWMTKGLSVYAADIVTPRSVLQAMIDDWKAMLEDESRREQAEKNLQRCPDVESAVKEGWRLIKIAVADIKAMGFDLSQPDEKGHLNILGERSFFKAKRLEYVELIITGKARILSAEECLAA